MQRDIHFTLVTKTSQLEDLVKKYNTLDQARFYISHLGQDFNRYQVQHDNYYLAKQTTIDQLEKFGRVHVLDRTYLANYIFAKDTIVVVLGPDGLVANTMKYLDNQPIIGVNPDCQAFDGILLPFGPADLRKIIPEVLARTRPIKEVTMAKASLSDGQVLYGVNDLFIGPKSHTSARYCIHYQGVREQQSSSGIIISTGLGSTGWLKSIIQGAYSVVNSLNPPSKSPMDEPAANNGGPVGQMGLDWDSQKLVFSVREPFPSISSQASCVFGEINPQMPLKVVSNMAENGVIFSDGMEEDFLHFSSGIEASISIAKRRGHLVI